MLGDAPESLALALVRVDTLVMSVPLVLSGSPGPQVLEAPAAAGMGLLVLGVTAGHPTLYLELWSSLAIGEARAQQAR